MIETPDINVLVYCLYDDSPGHPASIAWLREQLDGRRRFALCSAVATGFVRVATRPRKGHRVATVAEATDYVQRLLDSRRCTTISPGGAHWRVFREVCDRTGWFGNLTADAAHAATALEHGCIWVTFDDHFQHVPGLTWRHLPSGQLFTNPT